MIRNRWMTVLLVMGLMAGIAAPAAAGAADAPRMTMETLKGMLGDPNLVIVDVRQGRDWDASEFKIKGAVRNDPAKFDSWKDTYPKDKTIVLYCA